MPGQVSDVYYRPVQRESSLAHYYPLILRAVQALDPGAAGDHRRALYERAREALASQLKSTQPPLSVTEITRERLGLEEAIRKVEAEYGNSEVEGGLTADRFRPPSLNHSDPLAELARLIGQIDPFRGHSEARFDEPRYDDALYGAPEDSSIPPLHRYSAQQSLDPFKAEEVDIPAGPPAWLEEVRKRARNVAEEIAFPTTGIDLHAVPPIEVIPEQDPKSAIAFRPSRRGPLELLPDPPKDPHDPEQSQLYFRIRQQLQKLQADIPSQERAQIDDALEDFLAQPASWH